MAELSDGLTNADPSSVNNVGGLNLLKRYMRSIVMSRLAFETFKEFNAILPSTHAPECTDSQDVVFDDGREAGGKEEEEDPLKQALIALVKDIPSVDEPGHTKAFCKDRQIMKLAHTENLTAHPEWTFRVPRPQGSTSKEMQPRTDIAFVTDESISGEEGDDGTPRDPVTLLEFGKSKKHDRDSVVDTWYAKFGQGIKYVDLMTDPKVVRGQKRKRAVSVSSSDSYVPSDQSETEPAESYGVLRMERPMLYYTVVYSGDEDEEENPNNDGDDNAEEEDDSLSMMIGCFLCQPKSSGDAGSARARVALMYRNHVKGAVGIADALYSVLKEILWFKRKTRGEVTPTATDANWVYLGPHCALVTDTQTGKKEVYRAYDCRPWPIARSPAVYESAFFPASSVRKVIDFADRHLTGSGTQNVYDLIASGTGETPQGEDASTQRNKSVPDISAYRLFDTQGNVKVLAVPFIVGSHMPENIQQVIAVARHLKSLHARGFVHGDVRLLNIVFCNQASQSVLIDFDFGGDCGNTKYPPGYRQNTTDGRRSFGVARRSIAAGHDVASLVEALDLVLGVTDQAWSALRRSSTIPSIDDVITVLQRLEQNGEWRVQPLPTVSDFLEKHTKLERENKSKTATGDGDPKSPAKHG